MCEKKDCTNKNKLYKYFYTLLYPENSKYYRIPCRNSPKTIVLKNSSILQLTPNSNKMIAFQWVPQYYNGNILRSWQWDNTTVSYDGVNNVGPASSPPIVITENRIPANTPVRLVGASMRITNSGNTAKNGTFIGSTFITSTSSSTVETSKSIINTLMNSQKVKVIKGGDGMVIRYIPYNQQCFNFWASNTDLGYGSIYSSNGLIDNIRFQLI